MASTRAFCGLRLSASDEAPLAQGGAGQHAAAAGPAREHDQDAAPSRLQERLGLRGRRHAGRQRRRDDGAGAGGDEGLDGGAVGPRVRRRDVHARQLGAAAHVELRPRCVTS